MLDAKKIAKLRYGRLVYAEVLNSSGTDSAGPHWGIMLDSNEEILDRSTYVVVMISHDDTEPFIMPVPDSSGLTGFVQGQWVRLVRLASIEGIGGCVQGPDMLKVEKLVNKAAAAKKAAEAAAKRKRSTNS